MRNKIRTRTLISLVLTLSLLLLPIAVLAKKGDKNFKKGMQYESAQQWDKAAQEYTLAVAADPSNLEYQLHFRRASFNASQGFMQQGRSLAEQRDYIGAYNAFRQAYGYDPVNELAVSEMERMVRLQNIKEGRPGTTNGTKDPGLQEDNVTPVSAQTQDFAPRPEQLRVITYSGDLKAFIRSLAEQLNLNVIFDRQSFAQSRTLDVNLRDVSTAQALDYVFLQEGLFFQKLSRRTILVADQSRRPQYQQLVLRTFFLSNMKPTDARTLVQQAIPPSVGRPQTIVVPDDATNSLTVRDTAENVRLIGDLLQSIDKDRAEVVMDVNIYEVSKNDLLQLGNQIGTGNVTDSNLGGAPGFSLLTGNATTSAATTGVNVASIVGGVPTALAAALVIPPSVFRAFQSKENTKLVAATQVHAFNGEESQARIGQRVPVQTAQAYPFGIQTGQPTQPGGFPTGGFPVINYEPTGLTLKFTPQVFPNLDVQVKMSIEQKDVLNPSSLTPIFTERTMAGTARVQNNRTMMLASISTNNEARGRRGMAVLGGLPWIGRLFSSPTRDIRQIDIVIAVTPRVLRAPAVTPRDEEMRPSGTLQSPTTGSLEAMIREADRDDQIAAARSIPKNVTIQLPDAPAPQVSEVAQNKPQTTGAGSAVAVNTTAPATTATAENTKPASSTAQLLGAPPPMAPKTSEAAKNKPQTTGAGSAVAVTTTAPATTATAENTKPASSTAQLLGAPPAMAPKGSEAAQNKPQTAGAAAAVAVTPAPATTATAANTKSANSTEELPSYVPAPKSLVSDRAASEVAAVNSGGAGTQNAVLTSLPKATSASLDTKSGTARLAQISFLPTEDVMRIGEKRRFVIQLNTDFPLSLALLALRFDPRVVKIQAVSPGPLLGPQADTAPAITQSIDPTGVCLISVSALNGKLAIMGAGPLIFIDVEAVGAGDASLIFDKDTLHLVATDARDVVSEVKQGTATVKQ